MEIDIIMFSLWEQRHIAKLRRVFIQAKALGVCCVAPNFLNATGPATSGSLWCSKRNVAPKLK
jgi:hypothetical protein